MQTSNKELLFLSEEQDKIRKQDWSDHMAHPPDTRRQYEVMHPPVWHQCFWWALMPNADPPTCAALMTICSESALQEQQVAAA